MNGISPTNGYLNWTRIISWQGQEQFCSSADRCAQAEMTLRAAPGYDNLTGLGSPGDRFLGLMSGH